MGRSSDSPPLPAQRYRPREFGFDGVVACEPLRIKLYTIGFEPGSVTPVLVHAARHAVESTLPAAAAAVGDHHGLGYAILHAGEHANWLLLDWWAHDEICCQRMLRGERGAAAFEPVVEPYQACVWEHVVVAHEYGAWRRTMLEQEPDAEAYLADVLAAGLY